MNLVLDIERLRETEDWQARNFDRSVERIRSILLRFLEVEVPEALRFIDYSSRMGPRGHAEAAAMIVGSLVQAINNCDVRGMTHAGCDIQETIKARLALEELREQLPPEIIQAWDDLERGKREERETSAQVERDRIAARQAVQCQAQVHEAGRGVGFHQCLKKATGYFVYEGVEYRGCGSHKGERGASPYKPIQQALNTDTRP